MLCDKERKEKNEGKKTTIDDVEIPKSKSAEPGRLKIKREKDIKKVVSTLKGAI